MIETARDGRPLLILFGVMIVFWTIVTWLWPRFVFWYFVISVSVLLGWLFARYLKTLTTRIRP